MNYPSLKGIPVHTNSMLTILVRNPFIPRPPRSKRRRIRRKYCKRYGKVLMITQPDPQAYLVNGLGYVMHPSTLQVLRQSIVESGRRVRPRHNPDD